ncbi:hypothetical protein BGZ61DRAFT_362600 [Ilyonectria robusta]|uniref:uncharacterized protein n=1 Tax=Ilyonectria robusta TaxID=1079257 RepID=UPI001E8E0AAC|nr:uncharacterized protein BGZ61DRAFT_362600 [Ilyonectria robusta]KAH8672254.1 hypothetical protein BGZ61DRAFT_362600 [Ilyonectria robusta]
MDPEILNWLTPVDYQDVQDETLQRQQPGTSQWLIDTAKYKTWLNTPRCTLVCWGSPGVGKTVLASFVVDQLARRRSTNNSRLGLGFIFFRISDSGDQRAEGHFFLTLLKQLAQHQTMTPQALQDLYDTHRTTGLRPSVPDILAVLQSVARLYDRVFFVIDALDECPNDSREELLSAMSVLQSGVGVNFFATSRRDEDIPRTHPPRW